jgi:hypothetical protein
MRIWPPKFPEMMEAKTNEEPPSEAWLFAQAILGNSIPKIVRPVRSSELVAEQAAYDAPRCGAGRPKSEADAHHERELLEWAAQISGDCETKLSAIKLREAEIDEAWARAERFAETLTNRSFDPSKHPRGGNPENRGTVLNGLGCGRRLGQRRLGGCGDVGCELTSKRCESQGGHKT